MALKDLWQQSKDNLKTKRLPQIIGIAGDGSLKDHSQTSNEFREFLHIIPSELLKEYADQCLTTAFEKSGFALQDIINEIGERLDFNVTPGVYMGKSGKENFDGLWITPNSHHIIIEVKTTDAYRIDIEKYGNYRNKYIKAHEIEEDNISILFVVGRDDTGGLESQIRGSKYAWDIRVIGVSALLDLLLLKEDLTDPQFLNKFYELLIPKEYTRLDQIIELMFSTAEEVKEVEELDDDNVLEEDENEKKKITPVAFRDACIERIEKHVGKSLVKKWSATYRSSDNGFGVVCSISRVYEKGTQKFYWFAFHPHQKKFLEEVETGYVAFGCGSEHDILLVPFNKLNAYLDKMNITERKDGRFYWHIHLSVDNDLWQLSLKKDYDNVDVSEYVMK